MVVPVRVRLRVPLSSQLLFIQYWVIACMNDGSAVQTTYHQHQAQYSFFGYPDLLSRIKLLYN